MNAAFGRGLWRFCVAYIDDQSPTFLFVIRRGALRTSEIGFAAGGAAPIRGKTVNVCRSPKYVDADAVYESFRFEIVEGEDLEAVWKALPRAVREEHIAYACEAFREEPERSAPMSRCGRRQVPVRT